MTVRSDSIFEFSSQISASESHKNNGFISSPLLCGQRGKSPDPDTGKGMFQESTAYKKQRLNKFVKRKYKKTSNLISGETELTEEQQAKAELGLTEIISHWHPNITLNIVYDYTPWVPGQVPPLWTSLLSSLPTDSNISPSSMFNDYWNLNRDYMAHQHRHSTAEHQHHASSPSRCSSGRCTRPKQLRNRFNVLGNLIGRRTTRTRTALRRLSRDKHFYLLLSSHSSCPLFTPFLSSLHLKMTFCSSGTRRRVWRALGEISSSTCSQENFIGVLYVFDNDTNFVIRMPLCWSWYRDLESDQSSGRVFRFRKQAVRTDSEDPA